jgi:hypothetical protein
MKKIKILLIAIILLSAGGFMQQVTAQEKTKAELEKEAKLQQSILDQKKAMSDQKKAQAEAENLQKEQEAAMKDLIIINEGEPGKEGDMVKVYRQPRGERPAGSRAFSGTDPFIFNYQAGDTYFGHSFVGDEERTTWDFSKSVKENSFSRDYSFDVEKTVKNVVMSIMGDCKTGDIRIKIIMPNGKSYSEIVIDEFGNLNWRKSFSISETENQDKTGEWKFQITSNKATGFFKISLQTY